MMKEINAAIVDDEVGCINNLHHYLSAFCPRIKIVGTASNAASAIQLLNTEKIDIAFLDIQLFDQNIFEVLKAIDKREMAIVFVTAFEQYAINAIKVSALDYLLKPLVAEEVIKCYEKIVHFVEKGMLGLIHSPALTSDNKEKKILLRQGDSVFLLCQEYIVYLKANGFYTEVCFELDGKYKSITIGKPITLVYKEWNLPELIRVHRSYIINQNKVKALKRHGANFLLEMSNEQIIPVAKRRVSEFLSQYRV